MRSYSPDADADAHIVFAVPRDIPPEGSIAFLGIIFTRRANLDTARMRYFLARGTDDEVRFEVTPSGLSQIHLVNLVYTEEEHRAAAEALERVLLFELRLKAVVLEMPSLHDLHRVFNQRRASTSTA